MSTVFKVCEVTRLTIFSQLIFPPNCTLIVNPSFRPKSPSSNTPLVLFRLTPNESGFIIHLEFIEIIRTVSVTPRPFLVHKTRSLRNRTEGNDKYLISDDISNRFPAMAVRIALRTGRTEAWTHKILSTTAHTVDKLNLRLKIERGRVETFTSTRRSISDSNFSRSSVARYLFRIFVYVRAGTHTRGVAFRPGAFRVSGPAGMKNKYFLVY